ncbi:sensor histidine kinase [Cohnella zeiphila]|uniref:sensor histidine kinase n=1 Tax=Cohnella zeiphila TaxID=2761120 RepID=UPI001EE37BED|nr:sensor histidine kinase [Cohnella zeiphila]
MLRRWGWLRRGTGLQAKLFLTFFPLLVLLLGAFLVYVNWYVLAPLKEKTVSGTLLTATKVSDQMSEYIDVQDQLSQRILANKDLFDTMSSRYALDSLSRIRTLKDIMFQALGPSLDIRDMIIYDLKGRPLASYIGLTAASSLEPVIEDARYRDKLDNSSYVLYPAPDGNLAFIREVNDNYGNVYGYMYILLDRAYLQKVADSVIGSKVYVFDSSGTPIVKTEGAADDVSFKEAHADQGIYTDPSRNYVAYQKSADNGWTTYIVTSKSSVLGSVNSVKNFSIIMIVSLTLFSLLYVYVLARNFVLPIRRLRGQIMRMNYSNLNLQADSRLQNNDLQLLNEAFGEMLDRLQTSIEREKLAVHEEAMARNTALQAQIAPHFIHNALYLISIAAQEGRNEVVSDMCKQLSESLRYIVSSPYKHVNMREEIEHTKRYLSLAQRNYEEDLTWEIQMDPAASDVQLPRLVLQPFVENCIEHAFENTSPPWRIRIQVKLYNGLWAVEISDNGQGIDREKIKEILDKIEESDYGVQELRSSSLGIGNMGIINTVNRLKLMYKNRLFFHVFNNEDSGTTIQIIASLKRDFY